MAGLSITALLHKAGELASLASCNDCELPNDVAHRRFLRALYEFDGDEDGRLSELKPQSEGGGEVLFCEDWRVLEFFAKLFGRISLDQFLDLAQVP